MGHVVITGFFLSKASKAVIKVKCHLEVIWYMIGAYFELWLFLSLLKVSVPPIPRYRYRYPAEDPYRYRYPKFKLIPIPDADNQNSYRYRYLAWDSYRYRYQPFPIDTRSYVDTRYRYPNIYTKSYGYYTDTNVRIFQSYRYRYQDFISYWYQ